MQGRLFPTSAEPSVSVSARFRRIALAGSAFLEHVPSYVRGDDLLFDRLQANLRWHHSEREMYERSVAVPRLLAGLPADGPVDPVLQQVSDRLSERYRRPVDSISLALYRDGRDSVAYHGDRMGDQLDDCIVAILSLRGPRRLRLRPKAGIRGEPLAFDLGHGDLLVMGGSCQRDYEHGVPKVAYAPPRISVMFRST